MTPRGPLLSALGACTLLACSAAVEQEPPRTPEPPKPPAAVEMRGTSRAVTDHEYATVSELMKRAEEVRGLNFRDRVEVLVQDADAITAYVEAQIEAEELERARILYTALGLLDPALDVKALLLRLMGEQVVGYYDPEGKRFVVRDDVMRTFEEARAQGKPNPDEASMVLVHELVHALQDQHLGLGDAIEAERDVDQENAFRALIEGDATLAMIGAALPADALRALTSNPAHLRSLAEVVESQPMTGQELHNAPPIVREPLLSAYVDGLGFAARLHGAGGWRGVDGAHRKPPASTEHILHPERYERGEQPDAVALPGLPSLRSAGYSVVEEETLGELEIGIYFGQGGSSDQAKQAADGWGGDRLRVLRRADGATTAVWLTSWDTAAAAREAEWAARAVVGAMAEPSRARAEVRRQGRAVLIVHDLEPELRKTVMTTLEPAMAALGAERPAPVAVGDKIAPR